MTTERLALRHTREILRQKFTLSRSHRAVAQSLGISSGAVGTTVLRAHAAGLDWPQVEALTDDALEVPLYGLREVAGSRGRPSPDLHLPARRAPQARRHPGAAPPRSRGLPVHPVLRAIPTLAAAAAA